MTKSGLLRLVAATVRASRPLAERFRRPRAGGRGSRRRPRRRRRGAAAPRGSRGRRRARRAASCGSGLLRRRRGRGPPRRSGRAPGGWRRPSRRRRRGSGRCPAASTARGTRRSRASRARPGRGSAARDARTGARTRQPPRAPRGTPTRRRRARARSRSAPRRSARRRGAARPRPAPGRRPRPPRAPRPRAAPRRRRAAPRACARAGRADHCPQAASDQAERTVHAAVLSSRSLFSSATRADADRGERRGLLDRELARAPELEHGEEGRRLLEPRHLPHLRVEVEPRAPAQQRAEPLEELRDRREAQRHVRERDLGRLLREQAQRARERLGILRRERVSTFGASGAGPRRK